MNAKIYFIALVFLFLSGTCFSQYKVNPKTNNLLKTNPVPQFNTNMSSASVSLGILAGFARFEGGTGLNVGLFAEIKTESFSFVPEAIYWKIDEMNNFEMAGLVRMKFKTGSLEPYVDGGIGLNFLNTKNPEKNDTKVGLDLGGGIDFITANSNYTLFGDAKYKIIVGDPNIKGITISGGIKFNL
jgi:hypothetical protein